LETILNVGQGHQTQFWKRTIQWVSQMTEAKIIFQPIRSDGDHLGTWARSIQGALQPRLV
jgi:hypothetical protein